MKNEKDNQNLHVPFASKKDMILYATLGVLNIALVAVLCEFALHIDLILSIFFPGANEIPPIKPIFIAVVIGAIYLVEVAIIGMRRIAKSRIYPTKSIHGLLGEEGSLVFKNSRSPIIIFDFNGKILWYNDAMRSAIDSYNNFIGEQIDEVLSIKWMTLSSASAELRFPAVITV
ncbi:MAG: hypothetical protein J6V80_02905 [Clostridia bacterium]|nr:hypothetical protein [Clostridia bacterium]